MSKNSEDISPELKELLYYMEHTTEEIYKIYISPDKTED